MLIFLNKILSISRPRFWIYEFGTLLIGLAAAYTTFDNILSFEVLIFLIYFLVPANILIYGINDIFDYETDRLNPKKVEYEELLEPAQQKSVWLWILITNIPFILFAFTLEKLALISLLTFVFFAVFYSAKPIRAKSKPLLDSIFSASHYIATGVFGYYLIGGESFPIMAVIAGLLWAIAMHAYSAVPDIKADKDANLKTIATTFGAKGTIFICLTLYGISGYIGFKKLGLIIGIMTIFYIILMIKSLIKVGKEGENIFEVYKFFPYLNLVTGAIITLSILVQNPYIGF
jgi:4-hydroxybenzoate polyprenyltransferase